MVYIIRLRPLLLHLGTSLATAFLAAILHGGGIPFYEGLRLPPGAPMGWVLGVVGTLLSVLMGLCSYLLWQSDSKKRRRGLRLYAAQLAAGFLWPFFFFTLHWAFFSFLWVLFLGGVAVALLRTLWEVHRIAAYFQIPYCLWLAFTAYWTFGVFVLN